MGMTLIGTRSLPAVGGIEAEWRTSAQGRGAAGDSNRGWMKIEWQVGPKLSQACGSDSANANLGIAARRFPCSVAAKSTMALVLA